MLFSVGFLATGGGCCLWMLGDAEGSALLWEWPLTCGDPTDFWFIAKIMQKIKIIIFSKENQQK